MKKREPVFFYMRRAALDGAPFANESISRRKPLDEEEEFVRVAIVEVEPSLIEKAWDLMSDDAKEVLCRYQTSHLPEIESLYKVSNYMNQKAVALQKAASCFEAVVAELTAKGEPIE